MSDRMPQRAVTCLGCVQYRVTAKILANKCLVSKTVQDRDRDMED